MSRFKHYLRALPALGLALVALGLNAQETTFSAKLTGAAHLPEPVDTKAEGDLTLRLSPDGKKLDYTITVKDLQNAAAADLHLGPATANGPLVVKLFPRGGASAKKGSFTGTLAQGSITAADLTGPLTGSPLADLVAEIRSGNSYVNIHTNDGMDPPNSGPGDYRLGEIRGQIQ